MFEKALVLTSPPAHYPVAEVKTAQEVLAGHNVFHQNFHPGVIDGVYGTHSVSATYAAKNLSGYPTKQVNGYFGETLYNILSGHTQLPADFVARRKARMDALQHSSTAKSIALKHAMSDAAVGIHEAPPGTNRNEYGKKYGFDGVPWCCVSITVWMVEAGSRDWQLGHFASYVGAVVAAAKARERHLSLTHDPEPGDLAIYEHDKHIEFFVRWINRGISFQAVGGNTSAHDGSYNNGGEVATNTRYVTGAFPVTNFIRQGV